jgi:hypothetical protein
VAASTLDGGDHIEDTLEVLVVLEREDPGELSSWEHFLQVATTEPSLTELWAPSTMIGWPRHSRRSKRPGGCDPS